MSYKIAAMHILGYTLRSWFDSIPLWCLQLKKANIKSTEYILKWSISTNVLILQFRQGIVFLLIKY